jgi:hypothetical protein
MNKKKVTLGQLQKLSPKKQAEIISPIIKANQEQILGIVNASLDTVKALNKLGAFKIPSLGIMKNITVPNINDIVKPHRNTSLPFTPPPLRAHKTSKQLQREAYKTELSIELLEKQLNQAKGLQSPQYDINTGILTFMNKDIQITLNSNREMVARVVLKNTQNMEKRWSWEEIVEKNGEHLHLFTKTKIYTATHGINKQIAQETLVKDFFIAKPMSTVKLNPKFLPK